MIATPIGSHRCWQDDAVRTSCVAINPVDRNIPCCLDVSDVQLDSGKKKDISFAFCV